MSNIRVSVIVAIIFTLLTSLAVAQESESDVALTISRTPCFGTCPVYTVTIYEDGTVVYNGENHVETTGTQTINIEAETVQQLVNGFVEAGYFDWNDTYTEMSVSDLPSVTTSVTHDGQTKQIEHYAGDTSAPLALSYLESWLDNMLNTQLWTGKSPQSTYFTPTTTPIITLEREACFGFCPVYDLVLYDDGTVVFSGTQNTDVIGVRVSSIEADMVTFLAERMALTGYFDWQDEYTFQIITDQAYIITSLTWGDNYKRILRYDGDPNAPIGLFRIEQEIDRLVDVSQWVGSAE